MSSAYSRLWKSKTIKFGAIICTIAFGGFVIWASLAPLAEGVIVYGKVAVENNRKRFNIWRAVLSRTSLFAKATL